LIDYLEERSEAKEPKEETAVKPKNVVHRPAPTFCIVAARDEADHVAALALARMLPAHEFNAHVIRFPLLAAEVVDEIAKNACKVVCISALPPHAAAQAGQLCKRLKTRFPDLKVMVALWTSENADKLESRLHDVGVDVVVTRLPDAIDKLRELIIPASLEIQQLKNQGQTTISRRG
jgi:PleD family two-component response regulator